MLDSTTKKNIDDCRDVLVGKVPDPKSQIEQITLALIYKFMDDMDREVVEKFKGKAKFFAPPKKTGDPKADKKLIDYSQYSWRKLFNPALSGAEVLTLYSEALERLQTNPNIPELFRNIFKNAYLPYRDPATLKLFLKHINLFEYSHSEKLGDAFEYLLSVMGSQGDAGQFRTPRHIIDFVTACVNPQKNETILDPACGTSGFLLSAYKYILNSNPDKKTKRAGGGLSPDEKKKLVSNFTGYDISPDMVRLSLANMFLHQFPTPKVYEYDSLSSDDRWNDNFDVILANPPFMTPKGGIRPHKRFGVQANKAEVLFTDYIAEHLTKNGRAGIVVPNGIVATSQTAYAQLRRNLVNDSLIAVISLPSGVFQPYSGVKTSILLLDKKLAKKSEHILFLKIENDGFDLGAQRREHNKNDLPLALNVFEKYKKCLGNDEEFTDLPVMATLVEKTKILKNKDVVLNADRYLTINQVTSEFKLVRIEDLCTLVRGSSPRPQGDPKYYGGTIPRLMITDVTRDGMYTIPKIDFLTEDGALKSRPMKKGEVVMAVSGNPGLTTILGAECCIHDGFVGFRNLNGNILSHYFYYVLNFIKDENNSKADGAVFRNLTTDQVKNFEIPLPPLEIQQQIVDEIDAYHKIIDGAKQIVNNYKPSISIKSEWEMVELSEVCEINPKKSEVNNLPGNTKVSFVPMADLNENIVNFIPKEVRYLSEVFGGYTYFKENDVLVAKVTPCFENGKAGIAKNLENGIGFGSSEYFVLRCSKKVLPMWIYLQIKTVHFSKEGKAQMSGTSGLQRIPKDFVANYKIPVPPIKEQLDAVIRIEEEMNLVESNKKLIQLFEAKIKNRIAEVWGVEPREKKEEELLVAVEPELIYEKSKKSLKILHAK